MIRSFSDGAAHGRGLKLVMLGLTGSSLALAAQAVPALADPTTFQTLNFGDNGTFLTGIRGDNIVGNYTIPGTTETGGLYYNMTTGVWSPMPVATPNGANFPGAIGSSPYGPNFGNPDGILRVVGSYQTEASAPYDLSYLYDGAAVPGQQITPLAYPGDDTLYTIAHSTFGHRVVGDYDTRLATGNAFIYDIDTGTYTTNNIPGAISTTAYGVYGDKVAGGYGEVLVDGVLHAEHGYIYDLKSGTYTTYDHPGAVATHFEGITGAGRSGEYNLVVNWVTADGAVHPAVMHVDALGIATWHEIDIPGEVVSSNSAYGDNVVGIYVNDNGINGYLATIPGIYNPIRNTGALTSSADNAAVLSGIEGDDIVNSGSIDVSGNLGVALRSDTYGVVTNSGTVHASGIAGAAADLHGGYGTLLNSGTLQTTAASDAVRAGADSYGTIIVNTGIIDGRIAALAGGAKRFENSGWLGVSGDGVSITSLFRGTFVQTAAGTYAMRFTDDGNDWFGIAGTAKLAGTLEATFQTSAIAPSTPILEATDGITGTFDSFAVGGLPALFAPSLVYAPTEVSLNVAADLSGRSLTPNQQAVGTALDGVINTPTDGLLTSLPAALDPLYALGADQLPGALAALSGEIYASGQTAMIGDGQYVRQSVLGRLRQTSYAPQSGPLSGLGYGGPAVAGAAPGEGQAATAAPALDGAVWAQAYGGSSDYDGGPALSGIDATLGGVLAGADARVGGWLLGGALGYTRSSADLDALSGSSDVDSFLVALYAGTGYGPWNLRLGGSYAFNQIDVSRTIAYPGYAGGASADYDGGTAQAFGEIGYGMSVGQVALEPFAGLAYVNLSTDGFSETGASAGLIGASSSAGIGYSSLGLRMATSMALANGMALKPRASLAWQYAFGDTSPEADLAFLSLPTDGFTVSGVPIAENTALVEIGLDLAMNDKASLGVSYLGQFADGLTANDLQASVKWSF